MGGHRYGCPLPRGCSINNGMCVGVWLDRTFGLLNSKFHYVAPQLFIFRHTVQIEPNSLHWNAHIFLFWLNPTGHSKFRNTSNHPPPATDSGRTACIPLYPPVQAVPPPPLLPFPFFPVPDRRALQQLALNVHVKHSDLNWPDLSWLDLTWPVLTWPDLRYISHIVVKGETRDIS